MIVPNPESALNEEAGKLLLENYDDYAKHARLMTKIHAQNKAAEFSSNISNNNNSSTTSSSTTIITSTTSPSTSSPKKFVSSQMMMKTTSQQITASTTEINTMTTNNSNTTNNSFTMNIPALITPLTVSNSMNESKSPNAMNNGGANSNHNHLKKSPTSVNSNDNQLASNNPTVTPKKRAGDKKLDKKQADKKRSLKRL